MESVPIFAPKVAAPETLSVLVEMLWVMTVFKVAVPLIWIELLCIFEPKVAPPLTFKV